MFSRDMQSSTFIFPLTFRLPGVITWTPFYLSLILLLQTLTLPASTYASTYGNPCTKSLDCTDTFFCSSDSGQCDCIKYKSPIFVHYYDRNTQQCVSIAGKVCTRRVTSQTLVSNCVPNAECAVPTIEDLEELRREILPDNYGVCKCRAGFERTSTNLCESNVFPTVTLGEGRHLGGPTASQSTDNKEDPNNGIDVDHKANEFGKSNGNLDTISFVKVLSISFIVLLVRYNE